MTKFVYWSHPNEIFWKDAYVISTGRDDVGLWIELNETIAHVRGGGQLADRGKLNDMKLVDVQRCKTTGSIRHYVDKLESLREGSAIEISIDPEFRYQNSVLHSAGHFLGRIIEVIYPTTTATNGHHYPGECRVDFNSLPDTGFDKEYINSEIAKALMFSIDTTVSVTLDGSRFVKIGNYDAIGCGGTHVKSTEEIKLLEVTKIKSKNSITRMSYSAL